MAGVDSVRGLLPLEKGAGGIVMPGITKLNWVPIVELALIQTVWCIMEAYCWNFTPSSPRPVGEHKEE